MTAVRKSHPALVVFVLLVATLVGALAISSIWANRQLLDTDGWVATSDRMLDNGEIRDRLADYLAVALVSEAQDALGAAGRPALSGAALRRARQRAHKATAAAVEAPRFGPAWRRANRVAHRSLLRILDEDEPRARREGDVAVNLTPVLRRVVAELSPRLSAVLPADAGRIEVMREDQLSTAQTVVRLIRQVPLLAVLLVAALYALALLLARPEIRRAVGGIGLSLAGAGLLALVLRALAGERIVDALLRSEPDRPAAEAAWWIATSTMGTIAVAAIALGALVAIWAVLMGESGAAVGLRDFAAPYLESRASRLCLALVAVISFLLLILWAPISALEDPLGVALFGAVILGGTVLLARQIRRESAFA